jgi:hypothetical protein
VTRASVKPSYPLVPTVWTTVALTPGSISEAKPSASEIVPCGSNEKAKPLAAFIGYFVGDAETVRSMMFC